MAKKKTEAVAELLEVERDGKGRIKSHLRDKWLVETPEEAVRQQYVCVLVNEYGYALEQMAEEMRIDGDRGHSDARADIVVWRSAAERREKKIPLVVVECKAENIAVDQRTYQQGGAYANYTKAPFFVAHNNRQTKYFKVDQTMLYPNWSEVKDIPKNGDSQKEIDRILSELKVFKEDEFADLLHQCHNIIRNREHLDPAAAFDEIAKILFVKTHTERHLRQQGKHNRFTKQYLSNLPGKDPVNLLFKETKEHYRTDKLFAEDDKINLKPQTTLAIVEKLEAYNLSDTGEDVKGIAFERFLGRTFRGEIGQFFTPRPIVEFMIRMMEPKEGELICDPASGSGGFLIRFFELVREQIAHDLDAQYKAYEASLAGKKLSEAKRAELLRAKWEELQAEMDQSLDEDEVEGGSRLWRLANRCIYGTDANDRMARTSKMNMIMHGDGHGGIHHHNGFLNINGIFPGRFDIILTNPPFGANVEPTDKVLPDQVNVVAEAAAKYKKAYGRAYVDAQKTLFEAAEQERPIAELFKLPFVNSPKLGKVKTEILFIERCLDLLKPGGRLGVVLPEGIFNNPSLKYVRDFVEDRAWLRAVVSLPDDTFKSSKASVKTSVLFLEKYTADEAARFATTRTEALKAAIKQVQAERKDHADELRVRLVDAKANKDKAAQKTLSAELNAWEAETEQRIATQARAGLKQRWNYPVFFYEAEHVGITATGDTDTWNELYPNPKQPPGLERTCLEQYQAFRKDPKPFLLTTAA
jgi:type I restriction enzyme M protein